MNTRPKTVSILALIILGVGGFFLLEKKFNFTETNKKKPSTNQISLAIKAENLTPVPPYLLPVTESNYLPLRDWNIPDLNLEAKAVVAYDIRSGKYLFVRGLEEKLPIASLTKLMTAVVIWENLKLDTVVEVTKESLNKTRSLEGNSDLSIGESLSVLDLLRLMLIKSSNDAAYVLEHESNSEGTDVLDKMNKLASSLGMNNTNFLDVAGLNDNGFSSVGDLVLLIKYSLNYEGIYEILRTENDTIPSLDGRVSHQIFNTNKLLSFLKNVIGGKTGYTDVALGNILLVVKAPDGNDDIISIILGSEDRFTEMRKLVEWFQKAYRWE